MWRCCNGPRVLLTFNRWSTGGARLPGRLTGNARPCPHCLSSLRTTVASGPRAGLLCPVHPRPQLVARCLQEAFPDHLLQTPARLHPLPQMSRPSLPFPGSESRRRRVYISVCLPQGPSTFQAWSCLPVSPAPKAGWLPNGGSTNIPQRERRKQRGWEGRHLDLNGDPSHSSWSNIHDRNVQVELQ